MRRSSTIELNSVVFTVVWKRHYYAFSACSCSSSFVASSVGLVGSYHLNNHRRVINAAERALLKRYLKIDFGSVLITREEEWTVNTNEKTLIESYLDYFG